MSWRRWRWPRLQGAGFARKSRRTGKPLQIGQNRQENISGRLGLKNLTRGRDFWGRCRGDKVTFKSNGDEMLSDELLF
jgi:hypothetical protein